MGRQLGVGFIGAGPATQAIHLPAIACFPDELRAVHVMDVDAHLASVVAAQAGAKASTDAARVMEDPAVDIVVVCSPNQFHAEQVIAAAASGKRAVLCEKPLATNAAEAEQVAEVARAAGTLVVVGAMHTYDPACVAAFRHVLAYNGPAALVRSMIYLPANDIFVDLSTEPVTAPQKGPTPGGTDLERQVDSIRAGVLGLAIHNLPLVRQLQPSFQAVTFARALDPWGYVLTLSSPGQVAQMTALMPGQWGPSWTFTANGPGYELRIAFPPSYVLAGSSVATLSDSDGTKLWRYGENGYQAEWRHLIDAAAGGAQLPFSLDDVVADLAYALDVADGASRYLSGGGEI